MASELDITNRYIGESLNTHGGKLVSALIDNIRNADLILKRDLIDSLNYKIDYRQLSLSLSFLSYGRIHDLKSRNEKKKLQSVDTNALLWGIKSNAPKKRNKKWYAKTTYGMLNPLIATLMYGLSDIERQKIIDILSDSNKTTIVL